MSRPAGPIPKLKTCTKCGKELEVAKHFRLNKRKSRNSTGVGSWCKACCSQYQKDLRSDKKYIEKIEAKRRHYRARHLPSPTGPCAYCGDLVSTLVKKGKPGHGQVDHIIPRSRGGTNDPANKQLVCVECNRSKNNMTHEEYLKRLIQKIVWLGLDKTFAKRHK